MLQSYYVITLLRQAQYFLLLSDYVINYGITASYFTFLSYWHQCYCKSKCFILITLLRQGTLLLFPIGIKATVKASVLFLLRCYTITSRYSTLRCIKATVNTSVFFVLHYYAITARYFALVSYWHQSYCKSKCFILIALLRYYGKILHSSFLLASKLLSEINWAGDINPHLITFLLRYSSVIRKK